MSRSKDKDLGLEEIVSEQVLMISVLRNEIDDLKQQLAREMECHDRAMLVVKNLVDQLVARNV